MCVSARRPYMHRGYVQARSLRDCTGLGCLRWQQLSAVLPLTTLDGNVWTCRTQRAKTKAKSPKLSKTLCGRNAECTNGSLLRPGSRQKWAAAVMNSETNCRDEFRANAFFLFYAGGILIIKGIFTTVVNCSITSWDSRSPGSLLNGPAVF